MALLRGAWSQHRLSEHGGLALQSQPVRHRTKAHDSRTGDLTEVLKWSATRRFRKRRRYLGSWSGQRRQSAGQRRAWQRARGRGGRRWRRFRAGVVNIVVVNVDLWRLTVAPLWLTSALRLFTLTPLWWITPLRLATASPLRGSLRLTSAMRAKVAASAELLPALKK